MIKILLISAIWFNAEPIRNVPGSGIVNDINNHVPTDKDNNSDKITEVHETTHEINGLLTKEKKKPSFYLLNNKAACFDKIPGTLKEVAESIPEDLRGSVYQLYLIKQQRYWNNERSYLFNEFSAYLNGSLAREQLRIKDRTETLEQSLQLLVYAYYAAKTNDSKIVWKYQAKRTMELYRRSGLRFDYAEKPGFKSIIKKIERDYQLW